MLVRKLPRRPYLLDNKRKTFHHTTNHARSITKTCIEPIEPFFSYLAFADWDWLIRLVSLSHRLHFDEHREFTFQPRTNCFKSDREWRRGYKNVSTTLTQLATYTQLCSVASRTPLTHRIFAISLWYLHNIILPTQNQPYIVQISSSGHQ